MTREQRTGTTLLDYTYSYKQDIFYNLNCHRVGIIQEVNTTNKTATVELIDKRVITTDEGEIVKDYSLLVDCPIVMQRTETGGLTYPLQAGDNCLVLFNDRDIDNWFETGVSSSPNSKRSHNLSDGLILPCLYNLENSLSFSWNNNATELIYQNSKISIDSKIGIENSSESLKDILNELITVIKSLQVVDPVSGNLSITGATSSALDSVNSKINGLLK